MTDSAISPEEWERFNFRQPNKLSRDQLRSLDVLHDTFTRRLATGVAQAARTQIATEVANISQLTWEDLVRTMPSSTMLVTLTAEPLPGTILIEADPSFAIAIAHRMFGGPGDAVLPRRPTDLERPALDELARVMADALADALAQFVDHLEPEVSGTDFSPQLVALTAPSGMVLVLNYSVAVPASGLIGDINVCIPFPTLAPALDRLVAHAAERSAGESDQRRMEKILGAVPIEMSVRYRPVRIPASRVETLSVGDVLVLDHRVNEPVDAFAGGLRVASGVMGRTGRRAAFVADEVRFVDSRAPQTDPGTIPGTHEGADPHE